MERWRGVKVGSGGYVYKGRVKGGVIMKEEGWGDGGKLTAKTHSR